MGGGRERVSRRYVTTRHALVVLLPKTRTLRNQRALKDHVICMIYMWKIFFFSFLSISGSGMMHSEKIMVKRSTNNDAFIIQESLLTLNYEIIIGSAFLFVFTSSSTFKY